jgi:hypothetical protein
MASVTAFVSFTESSSANPRTATLAIAAGTNRKVAVSDVREAVRTYSSVTFNGNAMTLGPAEAHSAQSGLDATMWWYDVPDALPADDYTVSITMSIGAAESHAVAWAIEGVATGAPEATIAQEAATGVAAVSGTITCSDGAVVVASALSSSATPTFTWSGGTVTEVFEGVNANFADGAADGVASGSGSKTVTATESSATGRKCLVAMSFAPAAGGPTITVQPANDVGIISNGQSTVYTATATGTNVDAPTWSVDGTPIADGGIYDIATTGAGTASCSSTLTITRTDKTGTPFDIAANFEDDNGDTDTDTVTDTWWTGPEVTTFPATDGDGESTATLTSDYVTGVGEAIEVRIPLSDGDVAVTVTTT